jgi:hypothetical protein
VRYIFISDQGGPPFGSVEEPTAGDLDFAAVGMLTIVRLADAHYYARGAWHPIAVGRLGCAELDHELSEPFHASASHFDSPTAHP